MARRFVFLHIGPPGFFHRLMVKTLGLPGISSSSCLWRTGLAVTIKNRSLLVKWDEEQKWLDIVVRSPPGESSGPLMEKVLDLACQLLGQFRGASYRDMVPFASSPSFQRSTFTFSAECADDSVPLIPFRESDKTSPVQISIEGAIRQALENREPPQINISMSMIPIDQLVPSAHPIDRQEETANRRRCVTLP